jgi:hypothetical protein
LSNICRAYGAYNDPKFGAIDFNAGLVEVLFSEMKKNSGKGATFFQKVEDFLTKVDDETRRAFRAFRNMCDGSFSQDIPNRQTLHRYHPYLQRPVWKMSSDLVSLISTPSTENKGLLSSIDP